MAFAQVTNRVARALARLPQQYKDKANIRALVSALVAPAQTIEDTLWQLYSMRSIETAEGVQLDMLGGIVGQPRDGLSDDDYRRYIRARIATNRSLGTVEELIKVARLVLDDTDYRFFSQPFYPASIEFHVLDQELDESIGEILISFLRKAKAAGVRIFLEFSTVAPESELLFTADTSTLVDTAHGFADSTTPTSGGFFPELLE